MLRTVLLAFVLMLCVPLSGRCQEPTYRMKLYEDTVVCALQVTKTATGTTVTLAPVKQPAVPVHYQMAATLELDKKGAAQRCSMLFGPANRPDAEFRIEAVPQEGGQSLFRVQEPEEGGTFSFAGPLVSGYSLPLTIGRLYDFKRGGEQRFAYLLMNTVRVLSLHTLTLTADGKETIELTSGPVEARRLRYRLPAPALRPEDQKGVVYVGPRGELLRSDTKLVGFPVQAASPAHVEAGNSRIELKLDKPYPITISGQKTQSGMTARIAYDNGIELSRLTLGPKLSLLQQQGPWRGKEAIVRSDGIGLVQYRIPPGQATLTKLTSEHPFFFPHWFYTEGWEESVASNPQAKWASDYMPLYTGFPGTYPFAMERLDDIKAMHEGRPVTVRRYRFTLWADSAQTKPGNYYDVYTDGKRLIAALGAVDRRAMFRMGWEDFTSKLTPPAPPDAGR
jgi:hypothetical protein